MTGWRLGYACAPKIILDQMLKIYQFAIMCAPTTSQYAAVEALKNGDTVTLVGFGTFSVKERAARTGRNPKTGEELQIKASKVPSFKPGKGLKDSVA